MVKKLKIILVIPGSGRPAQRETAFVQALLQEGLLSNSKKLHDVISKEENEVIHIMRFHGLGGTPTPSMSANPIGYLTATGQNLSQFITSMGLDENVTLAIREIKELINKEQATEVSVAMIGYSRGGLQIVAITNELQKIKAYSGEAIPVNLLLIDPAGGLIDHLSKSLHQYDYQHIPKDVKSIFIFLNDVNPSIQAKSLQEFYTEEPAVNQLVSFILPGIYHTHGENKIDSDLDLNSPLYFLLHCTRLFLQSFINDKLVNIKTISSTESGQAIINYIIHHANDINNVNINGPGAPWRRFGQQFTNVKEKVDEQSKTDPGTALHNFLHKQLAIAILRENERKC